MSELLEAWRRGPRDEDRAEALLAPFLHTGVVVASDTAGLSRMSQAFPVPVVLARVHHPRARLRRLLQHGRPIGRWFADNSTTLFDAPVAASQLLRAAASVHEDGPARVGIVLHQGRFWLVDDALHGPDAARVLELAERHSRGGETRITPTFAALLQDHHGLHVHPPSPDGLCNVEIRVPVAPHPDASDVYPLPYGPDVHAAIVDLDLEHEAPQDRIAAFDARYRHPRSVVVAWLGTPPPTSAASTLDALEAQDRMRQVARELFPHERKLWKDLAIGAFLDPTEALDTALAMRERCAADGLSPAIGLDRGELYLFPMPDGFEVAGRPINQASKLAEDLGAPGRVAITDRAAEGLNVQGTATRWSVSGIELSGVVL